MVQIRSVTIENFQSHKHTQISFSHGTNVIVGVSDSGKSAVLRALNWVVTNRPLGDAFRSEWGGETRVAVETTDGHVIERVRSASRNDYIVDGLVLTAFGTEVPQEVLRLLPLDEFSFQNQADPPFLLATSPGEAARLLNRAAALDEIDRALAGLNKTQLSLNRDIKAGEVSVAKHKEQLADYEDIPALEDMLTQVELAERAYQERSRRFDQKRRLLARARVLSDDLAALRPTAKAEVLLTSLNESVPRWNAARTAVNRLRALIEGANVLREKVEIGLVPEGAEISLQSVTDSFAEAKAQEAQLDKLQFTLRQAKGLEDSIKVAREQIEVWSETYEKESPRVCPLCGNEMRKGAG